jgi:hypothetical protein
MAMTKASLLARFKAKLGVPATGEGATIQDDVLGKIAEAVIEEIQMNGIITIAASIPVSTTGTAAAQTGFTTATGTGTIN